MRRILKKHSEKSAPISIKVPQLFGTISSGDVERPCNWMLDSHLSNRFEKQYGRPAISCSVGWFKTHPLSSTFVAVFSILSLLPVITFMCVHSSYLCLIVYWHHTQRVFIFHDYHCHCDSDNTVTHNHHSAWDSILYVPSFNPFPNHYWPIHVLYSDNPINSTNRRSLPCPHPISRFTRHIPSIDVIHSSP